MVDTSSSKFLALILRHRPHAYQIPIDKHGWVLIKDLEKFFSFQDLETIVSNDNKQRYSFNNDKTKIRANQGHSIDVDLEFKKCKILQPIIYHGTVERFLKQIFKEGLKPMSRLYVHLSDNINTAKNVGGRRGVAIVLEIDADKMQKDGYDFFKSDNNVILTKHVPKQYIKLYDSNERKCK